MVEVIVPARNMSDVPPVLPMMVIAPEPELMLGGVVPSKVSCFEFEAAEVALRFTAPEVLVTFTAQRPSVIRFV